MSHPLYIFHKNGKIKALDSLQALIHKSMLLQDQWEHTATINPSEWIEKLFNGDEKQIVKRVKSFGKKK